MVEIERPAHYCHCHPPKIDHIINLWYVYIICDRNFFCFFSFIISKMTKCEFCVTFTPAGSRFTASGVWSLSKLELLIIGIIHFYYDFHYSSWGFMYVFPLNSQPSNVNGYIIIFTRLDLLSLLGNWNTLLVASCRFNLYKSSCNAKSI